MTKFFEIKFDINTEIIFYDSNGFNVFPSNCLLLHLSTLIDILPYGKYFFVSDYSIGLLAGVKYVDRKLVLDILEQILLLLFRVLESFIHFADVQQINCCLEERAIKYPYKKLGNNDT